jgi:hypothetical protein
MVDDTALAEERSYTLLGPDRKPYASPAPGAFGGHRGGKIYGRLDCPSALRAIRKGGYVENRVFFADEATAIAAGYRPCATCLPEKYREWRRTGHAMSGGQEHQPESKDPSLR